MKNISHLNDFRSIMERGPAVIYHCQQYWEGELNYISPNVTELLGWRVQDFSDDLSLWKELIHPEDRDDVLKNMSRFIETGHQTHEYRMRCKDGSYLWVMDDVRYLVSENGENEGLVGYITNIDNLKKAEHSLKESELRHRTIFETVLEGIITIDRSGIVQDMNLAAVDMFGYQKEEVVGRNISMLMPEPYASQHDDYLARYKKTGQAMIVGIGRTVQGLRKNGEQFDIHLSVSELNLPHGMYFVGSIRDVSQRVLAERALQESQQRLKMSQDFGKIGTWDWNIEKNTLYWSEQAAPLYGLKQAEGQLESFNLENWVYPEDIDSVRQALRDCLNNGKIYITEHRVLGQDGVIRWIREQGNVIRNGDGQPLRMVGIVQDITEAKEREVELQRAREIADDANRAKSEFLSRMSHELRTPLNAILGFAQLLGMSRMHPLEDRQQKQVDQIVHAGQHLLDLINEVLDLARIESGRLDLVIENVNVADLMEECISLTRSLAIKDHISVTSGAPVDVTLLIDRKRLKQVLLNLLSNAVKYNAEGGNVHLDAEKIGVTKVRFRIVDNGPGIAADRFAQLFEPFTRLGAEQSGIEGTGIGLTLTKQLTEAMNGEIGFQSETGKGSTFWVEFPVVEEELLS